jgi:hypothetical protein
MARIGEGELVMEIVREPTINVDLNPENSYLTRCCSVVDIGTRTSPFGKSIPEVLIVWEVPDELAAFEAEHDLEPSRNSYSYTYSWHAKSSLRPMLENWRRGSLSAQELDGFDVTSICGAQCQIQFSYKTDRYGETWAVVGAVGKLLKTNGCRNHANRKRVFSFATSTPADIEALPGWQADLVRTAEEFSDWRRRFESDPEISADELYTADDDVPS